MSKFSLIQPRSRAIILVLIAILRSSPESLLVFRPTEQAIREVQRDELVTARNLATSRDPDRGTRQRLDDPDADCPRCNGATVRAVTPSCRGAGPMPLLRSSGSSRLSRPDVCYRTRRSWSGKLCGPPLVSENCPEPCLCYRGTHSGPYHQQVSRSQFSLPDSGRCRPNPRCAHRRPGLDLAGKS